MSSETPLERVLQALQERAKELSCLYRVDEILSRMAAPLEDTLREVAEALPAGWQYPGDCAARVVFRGRPFATAGFRETPWVLSSDLVVEDEKVGAIAVAYLEERPPSDIGPFLKEEQRLIDAVADRVSDALRRREAQGPAAPAARAGGGWRVVVDLLRRTDRALLGRVTRKMLHRLSWSGVAEAVPLLAGGGGDPEVDENRPVRKGRPEDVDTLSAEVFAVAAAHVSEREILESLETWIKEDRLSFLLHALESTATSLVDVAGALERYDQTGLDARELSLATQMGLRVSLIQRLLTDDPAFGAAARRWVEVEDFTDLVRRVVVLPESRGRLGGKSSGLFLATQVLKRSPEFADVLRDIRVPRTHYLPSDGIVQFVAYNDLDEVYDWKYRPVEHIRQEYPHLLQVFKNARFPPDVVTGLSRVLDELGERPLIVRSSSLLEDRLGSAFSGKYRSVFLANQGKKAVRLEALLDAVAEVYASVFSPDAIQYRAQRGLLEQHEEMAVMIQEVVGTRAGRYFLPTFSGVALSTNELRWSPRIRREDGLLRLVPGLGTRAVDRLSDDYPVLVAPGQPGLRVNVSPEEVVRYAPRRADVINLETNAFETVAVEALLAEVGGELPGLAHLVSVVEGDLVRRPAATAHLDPRSVVFTFEGLTRTAFVERMKALLALLRQALGTPVDLEFASDGRDLYLVQCRAQGYAQDTVPEPIPRDVPPEDVLFSARRYVSNGRVGEITHVVYVDPDGYAALPSAESMREVGRAVGRLNALLPKRRFILMGPGRWGSRGDIRLGVSVSYSDISNTAVLVEMARRRGNYVPDLSFGTHFFQDLVESSIRYLPLYPDDPAVSFQEPFFRDSPSVLPELLPELAHLASVLRVIDVPAVCGGRVLRLAMNADLDEAVAVLVPPAVPETGRPAPASGTVAAPGDEHWRWRQQMAQALASELDAERFGVEALYVFGSTRNATAGPGSDLDLIVHFRGTDDQRRALGHWLEGWSQALAEVNFLRTGYRRDGLLDVQVVTDDDLRRGTTYAAKIGAVTDAARPLPLRPR